MDIKAIYDHTQMRHNTQIRIHLRKQRTSEGRVRGRFKKSVGSPHGFYKLQERWV